MKAVCAIVAFALAAKAQPQAHVTWTKDIAPLVFERCSPCHRPHESAPFPLLTYADVKKHAVQIAAVTKTRFMPPWLPEPGPKFDGERRLADTEIALVQAWVKAGAPEGDRWYLPAMPKFTEGWQLGQPDLIVRMRAPYTLPPASRPGGDDVFRNFILPVSVPATRYVKAIEIRPGNKRVVHHANLLIDRTRSSRALDGKDGQPGFPGMDINIESDVFDPDGHFLFWKPGTVPFVEPDGMSWRLDQDTDLVLNMHLQPSGKAEPIDASVGIYFSDKPPAQFPMLVQLEHDGALDIPAGKKDFVITDEFKLPDDVRVLGVYPHAHYLGKDLEASAMLPSGRRVPLIHIKHWDLNWQAVYRYSQPIELPQGSVISMRYTYDNSVENAANPNHPPQRVSGGNRSVDEMGHLWLQVVSSSGRDRRASLEEAWMRHQLEKYPSDFSARYNLGALLEAQGKSAEAVAHFRKALLVKPDNATVINSLGAALQAQGLSDEASTYFQHAVELRPDYADAHYNLGMLLMGQKRPDEAAAHFRSVLQVKREDAAARDRLTEALQSSANTFYAQGKFEAAITQLLQILELQPENSGVLNNLGILFARTGDARQAITYFERAVRADPADAAARNNLQRAQARLAEKHQP